jgi:hypothetical protein
MSSQTTNLSLLCSLASLLFLGCDGYVSLNNSTDTEKEDNSQDEAPFFYHDVDQVRQ